jgi:cellulose synthase operon protein C
MPTINKRFLFQLVLGTALFAGLLFGVHAWQSRRIPDALKAQADRAEENSKPDVAIHYLKQYLEFRPVDVDVQERLTKLLQEHRNTDSSDLLLLYDRILRNDPSRTAVRREALKASIKIGRYSDAETHAEVLLREFSEDGELWQRLAVAQAGLQKSNEAKQSYENAIKYDPTDPYCYQRLAQYYWRELKQPNESRGVIERMINALPHDAEAYLTRARMAIAARETVGMPKFPEDPVADLSKALELDPENPDALLLLAEQYQKLRKPNEARDCLAQGMKFYPNDSRMVRNLAWLELNRGNIGAAVAVLEEGMAKQKDGTDLLVPLADLLVQLGETTRTEEIVNRLETRSDASAQLQMKYLKSRLAMRAQDWKQAVDLLSTLRTESVNLPGLEAQANLLLALCFQRQGETVKEQDTLKLILNKDPNHVSARVTLAQSYLNVGRLADAMKELETAVQSPYASVSTHTMLLRLKARSLQRLGGRPEMWTQLERIARELAGGFSPASSEPAQLRAELAELRGDLPRAVAILREEATRRPGDTRLWALLAEKLADYAGITAGLGVLDEAQAAAGDGAELRLARASLTTRDPARLRPLDPLAGQYDTWPDADQLKLLYGLVEVFDRIEDEPRLLRTHEQILARRPADLAIWQALGERAAKSGDKKQFEKAKDAAIKLDPSGKTAALFESWNALKENNPENMRTAIETLQKAHGSQPERADACMALARLHSALNQRTEAGKLFERAVRLEPSRLQPMQAYLHHLAMIGASDAVQAVLTRLSQDFRWAGDPFRRVVQASLQRMPPETAKSILAQTSEIVSNEPAALGWLADQYSRVGLHSESLTMLENAVKSPRSNADDWLRLAIRVGAPTNQQAAGRLFAQAKLKLQPLLFFSTLAAYSESSSWTPSLDSASDKRLYTQSRLTLKLSRFQRIEAIALLEDYLKNDGLTTADTAWAKRNMAMLLAVRGQVNDRQRAMQMLMDPKESLGESSEEKRATAAVLTSLSRHLDGNDRKLVLDRAVEALKELVNETRSPRDAYLLAQVYRSAANQKASTQVLNELLKADPKNIDYHIMALEQLSEIGNFPAAEPFAQRLIVLYPNEYRALSAVAKFECLAGRPEKSIALAEAYVRTADATAGDLPAKSARAAELLDELVRIPSVRKTDAGQRMAAAAIKKYEALAATRPEAIIASTGLLSVIGKTDEAMKLIEKSSRTLNPRVKSAAGLAALRSGQGTERQFQLVAEWLDTASQAEPNSLPIQLNRGEFAALRGDYILAEKCYQTVLDQDPRNVVALNNLAWILAPQPDQSKRAMELIERAICEVGLTGELLDTRARVRIAAKQFEMAESDLKDALTQEKTPLRMFHLALVREGQTPAKTTEALDEFRKAKERGLDSHSVHPADLPAFRVMDSRLRAN